MLLRNALIWFYNLSVLGVEVRLFFTLLPDRPISGHHVFRLDLDAGLGVKTALDLSFGGVS